MAITAAQTTLTNAEATNLAKTLNELDSESFKKLLDAAVAYADTKAHTGR